MVVTGRGELNQTFIAANRVTQSTEGFFHSSGFIVINVHFLINDQSQNLVEQMYQDISCCHADTENCSGLRTDLPVRA